MTFSIHPIGYHYKIYGAPLLLSWLKNVVNMEQWLITRAFKKYFHYRELIWSFVRRDIHARYKGTVIGVFWSVIHPLTAFCIYLLVFGFFLKVRMPNSTSVFDFALYFSAGYFPWVFFSSAVTRAATSIVDNRNYIKKVAFPSEIFPCTVVLSESITLFITLLIILGLSIALKGFSFLLLLIPIVVIFELIFALALALFVSSVTVFFRDLPQFLNSLFMVWFWLTPITYTDAMIPGRLKILVYINPMHHILAFYRSIFLHGVLPNLLVLSAFMLFSVILLGGGLALFRSTKRQFSDLL